MTRFRVDDLLGRRVRDANGRSIGRINEVRADEVGGELLILEYHLGTAAILERVGLSLMRLAGLPGSRDPVKVPWNRMDVSDPRKPRLLGTVEDLR
jgi:sporulation protein YlmC with PRC-barrel domain